MDNALNEIASLRQPGGHPLLPGVPRRHRQPPRQRRPALLRRARHVPQQHLLGHRVPGLRQPLPARRAGNFIAAFGARYDGDPRIGFINLGLVGLWGEWHTWPFDTDTADGYPNLMPTDAHGAQIVQAFDNAFNRTKLEIRYPDSAGGAANTRDIGYHDDSFCYRKARPLAGVTLPQSLGGADYAQLQRALNMGVENKWITDSMGGEVRPRDPELRVHRVARRLRPGRQHEGLHRTRTHHLEDQPDQPELLRVRRGRRRGGAAHGLQPDRHPRVLHQNTVSGGSATVGVTIANNGVAPFYYPWTVDARARRTPPAPSSRPGTRPGTCGPSCR